MVVLYRWPLKAHQTRLHAPTPALGSLREQASRFQGKTRLREQASRFQGQTSLREQASRFKGKDRLAAG